MNPGEIETLLWLVGSVKPQGVLEFGVHEGMTAQACLEYQDILVYQGIDVSRGKLVANCNEVPQQRAAGQE